jgi:hypothetical protein
VLCASAQRPESCREEVVRQWRQRSADERPPSAHLHPLKSTVRLGKRLCAVCHV